MKLSPRTFVSNFFLGIFRVNVPSNSCEYQIMKGFIEKFSLKASLLKTSNVSKY